jgi:hypothetical protein
VREPAPLTTVGRTVSGQIHSRDIFIVFAYNAALAAQKSRISASKRITN